MNALPNTDFYKKKDSIFLIFNGRYYPVSNSSETDRDYLELAGLRFPLQRGPLLFDEEASYLKRNANFFQNFRTDIERNYNENNQITQEILNEIEINQDILFFLNEIYLPKDHDISKKEIKKRISETNYDFSLKTESESIFSEMIRGNFAVVNARIYGLKQTEKPSFANFNGINFDLTESTKNVEDIESEFQRRLNKRLFLEAMNNSKELEGIVRTNEELKNRIDSFIDSAKNIFHYEYCYESGHRGYDASARCVYWLIDPHYNFSTKKSYEEGQSAATILLQKGVLSKDVKFAERKDRHFPFIRNFDSHCLGNLKLFGPTTGNIIDYLESASAIIFKNKAFHIKDLNSSYNQ